MATSKARLKAYVRAARLRTLPLASASVLAAGALVFESEGFQGVKSHTFSILSLSLLTVWLLQILANYANDLGDHDNGADANRGDRAVASGAISRGGMKRALSVLGGLALLAGCGTVWLAGDHVGWPAGARAGWIALGLFSMAGAYRYTAGKRPYGYAGWGDAAVMLFFGFLGVAGLATLATGTFQPVWLLPAWAIGAFSAAVLNLNNLRDHASDEEAGKRTLVVQRGYSWGVRYHFALLLSAWAALGGMHFAMPGAWRGAGWYLVLAAVHWQHLQRVRRTPARDAARLDPELKRVALSTAVIALFMLMSQLG